MSKIADKHGRIFTGKTRELYDDADTEQQEGAANPRSEPMRDAVLGEGNASDTERPTKMADNRPQPARNRPRG
jgi:hypothetical protein